MGDNETTMNAKTQKAVELVRSLTPEEREEFFTCLAAEGRIHDPREILKRKLDEALTEEPTVWNSQEVEDIRREGRALAEKRTV